MNITTKLYNKLPTFLQDISVTVSGIYYYNQRYGGIADKYYKELLISQNFTVKQFEEMQNIKLKELINFCYEFVPFYRNKWCKYGINIKNIQDISDLDKIPMTEKHEVKKYPEEFIPINYNRNKLLVNYTSGTTGSPTLLFRDVDAVRRAYAFHRRGWKNKNINRHDKRFTFGGRNIIPKETNDLKIWRHNYFENQILVSSYHLNEKFLRLLTDFYIKERPLWFHYYSSSMYIFAQYIIANNIEIPPLKAIITTGEYVDDFRRSMLENVFGCKVFDQYSTGEFAAYIMQCELGTYHLHPEYCIAEFKDYYVDDFNSQQSVKELITTSFVNYAMPLIRYRTNDLFIPSNIKCPCGSNMPTIAKIYGRDEDIIILPSGKKIGHLASLLFKVVPNIEYGQIVQEAKDHIVIKIVCNDFNNNYRKKIEEEFFKRINENIKLDIQLVDELYKAKSGKFKAVISKIKNER